VPLLLPSAVALLSALSDTEVAGLLGRPHHRLHWCRTRRDLMATVITNTATAIRPM
jgi:hypothetical protein